MMCTIGQSVGGVGAKSVPNPAENQASSENLVQESFPDFFSVRSSEISGACSGS